MQNSTWLLLLYGLPAKGNTARVTLWRKLRKYGAVQLKTSAYVLPDQPQHYERFQWLATEIRESGGEATLIRVSQIEGVADQQIIQMFNDARAAEYKEVSQACQALLNGRIKGKEAELAAEFGNAPGSRGKPAEARRGQRFSGKNVADASAAGN